MAGLRTIAVAIALAAAPAAVAGPGGILLELFTSQGCYSCPPAEKLLAERYLYQPDIVALEFHVDYWDTLVYRGSSWKDPYSSRAYTDRQVDYARALGGNPFTPQAVIQGAYSASGANGRKIDHALAQVRELDLAAGWDIQVRELGGQWRADVIASPAPADLFVVRYLLSATTEIAGGENKGKVLINHNIVTDVENLGPATAGRGFDLGPRQAGEGCAVVVQRPRQGVVYGAWPCRAG